MSDQQVAELYDRLSAGKTTTQPTIEQVFLRGWNAGIDFAIKQLRLTCDEVIDEPNQEANGDEGSEARLEHHEGYR